MSAASDSIKKKVVRVCDETSEEVGFITLQISNTTTVDFLKEKVIQKRSAQSKAILRPFFMCKGNTILPDKSFVLANFSSEELGQPFIQVNMVDPTNAAAAKKRMSSIMEAKDRPVMSGWGWKPARTKTGVASGKWNERFFQLQNGCLDYFEKEDSVKPKGSIVMKDCKVEHGERAKAKRDNCLYVKAPNGYFYIQFDEESLDTWLIQLRRAAGYKKGNTEMETIQIIYDSYKSALCSFGVYNQEADNSFGQGVLLLDQIGQLRYVRDGRLMWNRALTKVLKTTVSPESVLDTVNPAGRLVSFYSLELQIANLYPEPPSDMIFLMGQRQALFMADVLMDFSPENKTPVHNETPFVKIAIRAPIVSEMWALVGFHDGEGEGKEEFGKCYLVLSLTNLMIIPANTSILPVWSFMLTDVGCTAVEEEELLIHTIYKCFVIKFYAQQTRDGVLTGIQQAHEYVTSLNQMRKIPSCPAPNYYLESDDDSDDDSNEEGDDVKVAELARAEADAAQKQKEKAAKKVTKEKKTRHKRGMSIPPPPPPEEDEAPPPPPMHIIAEEGEDVPPPPALLPPTMVSAPGPPPTAAPPVPLDAPPPLPTDAPPVLPVPAKIPAPSRKAINRRRKDNAFGSVVTNDFARQLRRHNSDSD